MNLSKKKKQLLTKLSTIGTTILLLSFRTNFCFAESIGKAEVDAATQNIKRVITSIAMPLGGVLIFASVVVAAIKMIANANNPQKRAESIGSLAWICRWWCYTWCKSNYFWNYCKYSNKWYRKFIR